MRERRGRYVLRELSGYSAGKGAETVDLMVLDADYCYRVVGYWPPADGVSMWAPPLAERRLQAEAFCRRLNFEHNRWLHTVTA